MKLFLEMMAEAKERVAVKPAGVAVVREVAGVEIRLYAFRAGGQVRPGSFRKYWQVAGVKVSEGAAKAALQA